MGKLGIDWSVTCPESPYEWEVVVICPGLTEIEDSSTRGLGGESSIPDDDGGVANVEHYFKIGRKSNTIRSATVAFSKNDLGEGVARHRALVKSERLDETEGDAAEKSNTFDRAVAGDADGIDDFGTGVPEAVDAGNEHGINFA